MKLVVAAFDERMDFDQLFLRKLQYELAKNTYDDRRYSIGERLGEYKKHDYVTGREEVGALPEDVEIEMSELLSDLAETNLESPEHILTAAAYFHAMFENIHPFVDGNGRVGQEKDIDE
jgi:Fic family protein